MKRLLNTRFIWLLIAFSGCIDPYNPPEIRSGDRFLVVDGFINSGTGETVFKLSYTRDLGDSSRIVVPKGRVFVEAKGGTYAELIDNGGGQYRIDQLSINDAEEYRLRIVLNGGKEYLSDFVQVKSTPDIDSVTWKKIDNGIEIQVTSHDPFENTRYYSYEFEETWKFHSAFYSGLKTVGGSVEFRLPDEEIYFCFGSDKSTDIHVATSDRLESDLIYKFPLTSVSTSSSNKLSIKYSILVKQKAITKEAFEYWENLKKVSENMGSLFDPQPSTFRGNLYSTADENEIVLGFVSVCNEKEKRIFITKKQVGFENISVGYEGCIIDTIPSKSRTAISVSEIPIALIPGPNGGSLLLVGDKDCVDCTIRGAVQEPDFWE